MEMRLILGLRCLLLIVPGSAGDLMTPFPSNTAVLVGSTGVALSCASTDGQIFLAWNYIPVGGSPVVNIGTGAVVLPSQSQTYRVETSGTQQSNLIILNATMSTAGTYYCVQGTSQVSAQLIVISSDGAITISPSNRAAPNGVSNISMSCASSIRFQAIGWSYLPVGGSSEVYIATGSSVDDSQNQFYAIETSGTQQSNLIILSATMARAGTYTCIDNAAQPSYAQLIIINSDPVCSMTPNAPTELLYNQTVQMSCIISYTTNTSYVMVDMTWSKDDSAAFVDSSTRTSTSANQTTAISTITPVTPGNFTPFPIHRCNATFKLIGNPPTGSANNAPDYSKLTQLFSSPVNVHYLKPADASSITGARDGDRVYLGTTVTCNVDANPSASYNWTDVTYGNTTNSPRIQIWHDGEFRCTAWNKAARTSVSIDLTVYITTSASTTTRSTIAGGLSEGAKIGIGVGIGIGGMLILIAIIFAVLNQRYECIKRTKTDGKLDKRPEASDSIGNHGNNSNTQQYEPLKILSTQNSTAGPTYEQLTTSTNVNVAEHNLHNRPIYENTEYTSEADESSLAAYQSLQHRDLSPSDAYEAINTNK